MSQPINKRSQQKRLSNSYNRAIRAKLSSYAGNCKKKSIAWCLKASEALALFMGECTYCGRPAIEAGDKNGFNGIDRIDSSGCYINGNCCSCCYRCNKMKNDMSLGELRKAINAMHRHMNLWPVEFDN